MPCLFPPKASLVEDNTALTNTWCENARTHHHGPFPPHPRYLSPIRPPPKREDPALPAATHPHSPSLPLTAPHPTVPQVPFRPIGPPKKGGPGTVTRHFGGRIKGAVGEFEWRPRPEPPIRSRARGAAAAAAEAAAGETGAGGAAAPGVPEGEEGPSVPFRPVAFPKEGRQATFTKFPVYVHDPEEPKIAARAAQRKQEREHLAVHAGGAWRPGGGVKSDATKSIVRMNL